MLTLFLLFYFYGSAPTLSWLAFKAWRNGSSRTLAIWFTALSFFGWVVITWATLFARIMHGR